MEIEQKCSLVYKDGTTFFLDIYDNYSEPSIITTDPDQGDNNPIDATYRIKVFLENNRWTLQDAGQGDNNSNIHY